jgi:hypothetical protein
VFVGGPGTLELAVEIIVEGENAGVHILVVVVTLVRVGDILLREIDLGLGCVLLFDGRKRDKGVMHVDIDVLEDFFLCVCSRILQSSAHEGLSHVYDGQRKGVVH